MSYVRTSLYKNTRIGDRGPAAALVSIQHACRLWAIVLSEAASLDVYEGQSSQMPMRFAGKELTKNYTLQVDKSRQTSN